mmetsp:Transcript_117038/g.331226  ORF Transcript_117038/g.331226 Transcript_117038/m.331226 type:complete len:375 (+) Transcript_117038:99-1223(+)
MADGRTFSSFNDAEDDGDGTPSTEEAEKVCSVLSRNWRMYPWLMLASIFWIGVGVAAGMYFESWCFVTALYVTVQIITTIGYGDVTVTTEAMQVFMTVYVIGCMFLVANVLNLIMRALIQRHMYTMRRRLQHIEVWQLDTVSTRQDAKKTFGTFNRLFVAALFSLMSVLFGTVFYATLESCSCSYGTTHDDNMLLSIDGGIVDLCPQHSSYERCMQPDPYDTELNPSGFRKGWINALYMSVITVTTVGFGDFTPKSRLGRWIGMLWMIIGVAATVNLLDAVAGLVGDDGGDHQAMLDAKDINYRRFHTMDLDGDGYLNYAEYSRYVLLKHGLVDQEVLDGIDAKFHELDINGTGKVSYDMILQASARNRVLAAE